MHIQERGPQYSQQSFLTYITAERHDQSIRGKDRNYQSVAQISTFQYMQPTDTRISFGQPLAGLWASRRRHWRQQHAYSWSLVCKSARPDLPSPRHSPSAQRPATKSAPPTTAPMSTARRPCIAEASYCAFPAPDTQLFPRSISGMGADPSRLHNTRLEAPDRVAVRGRDLGGVEARGPGAPPAVRFSVLQQRDAQHDAVVDVDLRVQRGLTTFLGCHGV